jgi:hypothetical protein
LLIMQENDHNILQSIFISDPVKKIAGQAAYPVLVLR